MYKDDYFAVIGTCFIDIIAKVDKNYQPTGTNIASITQIYGGVGRNIAINLSKLNNNVEFMTAIDNSPQSERFLSEFEENKIGHAYTIPPFDINKDDPIISIGKWSAIIDENGNLISNASQVPDTSRLQKAFDFYGHRFISNSKALILDLDSDEYVTISAIKEAKSCHIPLFGAIGNLSIICEHRELLKDIDYLILNNIEASKLFYSNEIKNIYNLDDAEYKFKKLKKKFKFNNIVITCGSNGSVGYSSDDEVHKVEAINTEAIDTTGAGDAFISAFADRIIKNHDFKTAIEYANLISSKVVASKDNVL